jgi:hypothetical protein
VLVDPDPVVVVGQQAQHGLVAVLLEAEEVGAALRPAGGDVGFLLGLLGGGTTTAEVERRDRVGGHDSPDERADGVSA